MPHTLLFQARNSLIHSDLGAELGLFFRAGENPSKRGYSFPGAGGLGGAVG